MRILYATPGYKPAHKHGGPIISIAAVAERLAMRGHDVRIFTTNSNVDEDLDVPTDQPLDVDGVEVWYFKRSEPINDWTASIPYFSRSMGYHYCHDLAAALGRVAGESDIIHTHMPFVYPTYAAARAAIKHRRPFIYSQRGVLSPERLRYRSIKKRVYLHLVELRLMRHADVLLALTEFELSTYRALGLRNSGRVIPNGIDAAAYRMTPVAPLPGAWRVSGRDLVVLYLGRLHPTKRPDRLIEGFGLIAKQIPAAVLVVAGPNEAGFEERLRQRATEVGISDRVRFIGPISGEPKLDLLARANLFCLPSDAEGFSIAVLEALASATPVLISPGCHFDEVQVAGAGAVVSSEPHVMGAALARLLWDPERLVTMGHHGRKYVVENFSWDRITDRVEELYTECRRTRPRHHAH